MENLPRHLSWSRHWKANLLFSLPLRCQVVANSGPQFPCLRNGPQRQDRMSVKAALGFGVECLVEGRPGMAGGGLVWKDLEPGASVVQGPGACSLGTRSKVQAWSESWFRPCHLIPLAPPPKASQGSSDLSGQTMGLRCPQERPSTLPQLGHPLHL